MNAVEALSRIQALGMQVVTTSDVSAVLRCAISATTMTLGRLADRGFVKPVRKGVWWVGSEVNPFVLPDYLTAPYPAYLSMQTALHRRGMIEQIPAVHYVVSLGRSRQIYTTVGTYSVHRVAPEFFGGYEVFDDGVKLATPEKALLDIVYLSSTKIRRFSALPELELPRGFNRRRAREWIDRIPSQRVRTLVAQRFDAFVRSARRGD